MFSTRDDHNAQEVPIALLQLEEDPSPSPSNPSSSSSYSYSPLIVNGNSSALKNSMMYLHLISLHAVDYDFMTTIEQNRVHF